MDSAPRASATESANTTNGNGRRGLIDLARVAVEDTVKLVQQEVALLVDTATQVDLRANLLIEVVARKLIAIAHQFHLQTE